MVVLTLIAGVAYFRNKKEEKNDNPDILRFPSGKPVPPDEELLKLGIPELDCMPQRDSYYLSEYIRKRLLKCRTEEERAPWEALHDRINDVCFGQF